MQRRDTGFQPVSTSTGRPVAKPVLPLFLTALVFAAFAGAVAAVEPDVFQHAIAPFLEEHCADCHDADEQKGKFRVDNLTPELGNPDAVRRWEKLFDRVANGEMPPKKKARPPQAGTTALLGWVGEQLKSEGARRYATEGRAQRRRLNRIEYENTLRDLLGADVQVAALLPEDGTSHGFSTVDEALTLSAVQMEKYLEAADRALDVALGAAPPPPAEVQRFTYLTVDKSNQFERKRSEVSRKLASSVAIFSSSDDQPPWGIREFSAPAPGRYRIRVLGNGYQSRGHPVVFRINSGFFFLLKGANKHLVGYYTVPAGTPTLIEAETYVHAVRDSFQIVPYGLRGGKGTGEMKEYDGPGLEVHWVEIEGPLDGKQWPPATRAPLLGNIDLATATEADVHRILRQFAPRAFRRPLSEPDLAPYLALASAQLKKGATLEQALRAGFKAILVSPRFLMLDSSPGRLDGYALASRLSYFLWSTMPDAPLLADAAAGELAQPGRLHAQVERMLAHPKARAFTENFTAQWLDLKQIDATTPDKQLYPEFDELLQVSMLLETRGFFDELLRENLSVLSFIDSDWAMLNQRLAEHYQLFAKGAPPSVADGSKPAGGTTRYTSTAAATPLVGGLDVRRIALPPGSRRGGVLTQGAVLKVSANGTTTSPVIRGVWLLDRLLGAPVPPPPESVPAIEPDIRGATTIRDMLDKHRAAQQCAVCHDKIDPPGYALENYDVIGGWRDRYRVLRDEEPSADAAALKKKNKQEKRFTLGPAVEASDKLPTGEAFHGFEEFRRLILARPEPIVRGLTERLLIYSTGHVIEFADRDAVSAIVAGAKPSNYGLRSLIHAVVQSETFSNK
ncbi:MAG: DUF1592 domain-containing protein [Verrucomicrobiota bacterium]|nr:DUF1592 domain-containing protein [Verrucomicrobiota bacterium]